MDVKATKISAGGKFYAYENIYIIDAKRTPFGRFLGSYSDYSATDLAVGLTRSFLEQLPIDKSLIDQVIFANTIPTSTDAIFFARHVALKSGLSKEVVSSMAQRICASGLETLILAANDVALGASEFTLAGGAECMSRAPLVSFSSRKGFELGAKPFSDLLWEGLLDTFCSCTMGETAENLAEMYYISRDAVDDFAFESHQRAITANQQRLFEEEILPLDRLVEDETIRSSVDRAKLATLPPVFKKNGVQTPGNSSQLADGASVSLIGKSHSGNSLGKIVAATIVGEDPTLMGRAPVRAIQELLAYTALSKDDIDFYEINEAFGTQSLAVENLLGLDRAKVNVHGGSIGIGHPLAATGGRLVLTLLTTLKRDKKRYGIASACVGGGQAIAVLVERA